MILPSFQVSIRLVPHSATSTTPTAWTQMTPSWCWPFTLTAVRRWATTLACWRPLATTPSTRMAATSRRAARRPRQWRTSSWMASSADWLTRWPAATDEPPDWWPSMKVTWRTLRRWPLPAPATRSTPPETVAPVPMRSSASHSATGSAGGRNRSRRPPGPNRSNTTWTPLQRFPGLCLPSKS